MLGTLHPVFDLSHLHCLNRWLCLLSLALTVTDMRATPRFFDPATYDALKRPSVLVDDNGTPLDSTDNQTTRYGYDLAGRAVQLIAQNGQVTRNDYDELGRLTARTLFRSLTKINDAGRLACFTWTHDAIGNVLTQTEFWFASGAQPARQRATAMTNDAANRLISETITEPGLAQVTTTYSYDVGNNRTTKAWPWPGSGDSYCEIPVFRHSVNAPDS